MSEIGPNDITSTREIPLENGNTLRMMRTNPYGFIQFHLDKGQLPEFMKSNYTGWSEAEKALKKYMEFRKFEKPTEPVTHKKFDKARPTD